MWGGGLAGTLRQLYGDMGGGRFKKVAEKWVGPCLTTRFSRQGKKVKAPKSSLRGSKALF